MIPIKSSSGAIGSVWLTPFPVEVRGTLRGQINQYSDSSTTILTPKPTPKVKSSPFGYISL